MELPRYKTIATFPDGEHIKRPFTINEKLKAAGIAPETFDLYMRLNATLEGSRMLTAIMSMPKKLKQE